MQKHAVKIRNNIEAPYQSGFLSKRQQKQIETCCTKMENLAQVALSVLDAAHSDPRNSTKLYGVAIRALAQVSRYYIVISGVFLDLNTADLLPDEAINQACPDSDIDGSQWHAAFPGIEAQPTIPAQACSGKTQFGEYPST